MLASSTISAGASLLAKRTETMLISRLKWLIVPLALALGAAGGVVGMRMATPPVPKPAEEPLSKTDPLADLPEGSPSPFVASAEPRRSILETVPPGFFDIAPLATKDASGPTIIQPVQLLDVEVLEALPGRPITGDRVVRPDGTISLGFYGDVKVAGMNRNQIKVKLIEHLTNFINDEVLGIVIEDADGHVRASPPVKSTRIFVDESVNYLPGGSGRTAQRLDVLEGWIHRVVKEMNEIKSAINSARAGDPKEPGISDAEHMKRVDAELDRKNNVGRLDFMERELYKVLKELEETRAKEQTADSSTPNPARADEAKAGTQP
jgi:hypothetical protein